MDFYNLSVIFSFICVVCVKGFAPSQQTASKRNYERRSSSSSTLPMSNIFDDMGKFFDGLGKTKEVEPDFEVPPVEDVDGEYVGSKRIITIPVSFIILTQQMHPDIKLYPAKTMKIGGLRLYCNLYLMGLQNTPEAGCWKAHQEDDNEVNLRYRDMTGCIIIIFKEDEITIDRLGSMPSMKYLLHESIVLNGFLDQLDAIVFEGDVAEKNRLLTLPEPGDQILNARDVLSFS
eukprot:scaffold76947_cov59-Cyclotella_meneghiniana.AAC.4